MPDPSALEARVADLLSTKMQASVKFLYTGAGIMAIGGVVVLVLTFWFTYIAFYLGTNWLFHFRSGTLMFFSTVVLILLFWGNARTDREYLSEYTVDTLDGGPPVSVHVPHVGLASNINFASFNTLHSMTKIITDVFYVGPRLFSAARRAWARAGRLSELDTSGCAAVVTLLMARKGRVPFTEMFALLKDVDLVNVIPQLAFIEGVVFLKEEPQGLSLTSEMRNELVQATLQVVARK